MANQQNNGTTNFTQTRETVNLTEFENMIRTRIRRKQEGIKNGNPNVRVLNLWAVSDPGIGKTQRFQAIADEMGVPMIYIPGANLMQGDLSGIPVTYTPEGRLIPEVLKVMINEYFPQVPTKSKSFSEIDPSEKDLPYFQPGFLFIDEIGNMDPVVRSELLAYIDGNQKKNSGSIEWNAFPPTWFIVCAGNTETTIGKDYYTAFGFNVKAKFATYYVKADVSAYTKYMQSYEDKTYKKTGYHPMILSYLTEHKADLDPTPNAEMDNIASPRNWENVNLDLRQFDMEMEAGFGDPLAMKQELEHEIIATLGPEVGNRFLSFMAFEKDTIKPDIFCTTDLSKSNEYKNHNKENIGKINMTIYRALDYLESLSSNIKDDKSKKDYKDKLKMFQENTAWMYGNKAEDQMTACCVSMKEKLKDTFELKDLTPTFKIKWQEAKKLDEINI